MITARVRAALRSVKKYSTINNKNEEFISLNKDVKINLKSRRVLKNDEDVKLKPKEYELLAFFVENRDEVFSRKELLDKVWSYEYEGEIKKLSEGDFEIALEVKSNDEIGVLSREFISVKQKIKNQIDTINKEKDKVLKLEKARREFFNNVTHELKTPLTAIAGYGEMLLDEDVRDEEFKKRAADRICMESERLHELVVDLINVSKGMDVIEKEKIVIDMQRNSEGA